MNCCKKRRSFISLVCAILLVLSIISVPVSADGLNRVTASTGASVTQGDYAYCYVYIDSAEGLAALDVTVHYDPSRVQIVSTYNSLSCTLYDSATDTDSIRFSYILDGQGSTEKTRLFYFRYRVLSGACVGEAYFDITVGEAYDSALNEMAVYGSRCRFTIMESVPRKNCSIYGSRSAATAVGQEFTLSYRLSTREIASGTVVIAYDSELFRVVGVTNGAFLSGKVADINTDLTGEIYISFAGTEYSSATDLISVTFRTLCNVSETSEIRAGAKELLDKGLNAYICTGYTTAVTVAYDEKYTGDSPSMRLDGTFSYEDKQITLTVSLEEGSRLGAGDFVIGFDPELVTYRSCNKGFAPSFFNVNDKNTDSGELKFHIISLSDIVTDETVLTVVFDVNWPYSGKTADFTLSGTGLTDSMTEGILLNFIDDSVWLEYRVSFLDEDGTLLQSNMYHYGDKVTAPEAPTKESDVYGSYTFSGWDNPVTDCIADATYTATYTTEYIDYTVIFKDWDGTELSRKTYHYGDKVAVPEAPVRAKDSTYTYTFAGWDSEVVACNGNATYTATYDADYLGFLISGTVACLGATDGEITIRLLQNNAEVVSVVSADGTYSLLAPEPGDYILSVSKPDCVTKNYEITVERENILLNLEIYLIGDLNCDGEIAAADALMALQIAVGKLRPTEDQAKAADVDGEGGVTATDALLILQYAVGKIKKFPVKQIA